MPTPVIPPQVDDLTGAALATQSHRHVASALETAPAQLAATAEAVAVVAAVMAPAVATRTRNVPARRAEARLSVSHAWQSHASLYGSCSR